MFSGFVSFWPEGHRIYLSGEARTMRWLRASLGGSGERLELCVGGRAVAATAHESGQTFATTCSISPVDTSQLLSQGAGEVNLLCLRGTDREHRVEVCPRPPLLDLLHVIIPH
jgi:hypothetical protein